MVDGGRTPLLVSIRRAKVGDHNGNGGAVGAGLSSGRGVASRGYLVAFACDREK